MYYPALNVQLFWLFILAIPIACISWTLTHEEVASESREWCRARSQQCRTLFARRFFYIFTCEYCLSHYVTMFFLALTGFKLLLPGWRGYLIAGFSLVWVANFYMALLARIRLDVKHERVQIAAEEAASPAKKPE